VPYQELFVGPVSVTRIEIYREYARKMAALTIKAGALSASAGWGDDSPHPMLKSLASAVALETGEALVTQIVVRESKEARDAGWAHIMQAWEREMAAVQVPFDGSRVCCAGFQSISELQGAS
jgi:uncharacterized protein YbaA (DUF1428 family)